MFPGLQLQSHKSPKLLCYRAAIKRAAHLDSSSSAILSHEASDRPLSLVLFLSRLSRNRKTKLWRALLLSGRLTPTLQRLRKTTCSSPTFKTYQSRHVLPSTIAKTDEFTRHGQSWALCDSSQLRPSSSLEPQLITFDRRANESQEA